MKPSGKLLNFVQTYGVRYDKNRIHSDSIDASGSVFSVIRCGSNVVVKMNEAMSPLWNYFEVEIINHRVNCAIGIGVGPHDNTLHGMPGWTARSFGYHSDDGNLFNQGGYVGLRFGPTCTKGDIMGCGIDYDGLASTGYVRLWFTKNSTMVGAPVRAKVPPKGFHSLIGMHYLGELVKYLGHSQQKAPYSLQVLGEYVFLLPNAFSWITYKEHNFCGFSFPSTLWNCIIANVCVWFVYKDIWELLYLAAKERWAAKVPCRLSGVLECHLYY